MKNKIGKIYTIFLVISLLLVDFFSGKAQMPAHSTKIGILIFDNVQIIDYAGPYEVFGRFGNAFTVAQHKSPITTVMGMVVTPTYSFEDCPDLDVLVIPGGGGSKPGSIGVGKVIINDTILNWVKKASVNAKYVLSVCNGAFILAKAGMLDGLQATTTASLIPQLKKDFPKVEVFSDKRYVDNGKIIVTGGLSSGIDGSVYVVSKMSSLGNAQNLALGMEYPWDPGSGFARAALADKYTKFNYDFPPSFGGWVSAERTGDRSKWVNKWVMAAPEGSIRQILDIMNQALITSKTYDGSDFHWQKDPQARDIDGVSSWVFKGDDNMTWHARVTVNITPEKQYLISLAVSNQLL